MREGLVPCAPHLPTLAITVHILELYRIASLRCPHLAIHSFVKALCDLHGVPFRPTSADSSPSASIFTSLSASVWINGSKLLSSATTQDGGFVMPVLLVHTNSP